MARSLLEGERFPRLSDITRPTDIMIGFTYSHNEHCYIGTGEHTLAGDICEDDVSHVFLRCIDQANPNSKAVHVIFKDGSEQAFSISWNDETAVQADRARLRNAMDIGRTIPIEIVISELDAIAAEHSAAKQAGNTAQQKLIEWRKILIQAIMESSPNAEAFKRAYMAHIEKGIDNTDEQGKGYVQ